MTFALTKIQPPRFRVGLIEREELEARLRAALRGQRLVLLMAPAGYGKTAPLSRQLTLMPPGCATAWVTADAEDDLARFLSCLGAALEPYDPPWRMAPEALVGPVLQERGLRVVVDEFVNALGALSVEHGVIALDDMHSVTDTKVFEFLQQLLDHLPQQWTVAITTRVAPRWPWRGWVRGASWRSSGRPSWVSAGARSSGFAMPWGTTMRRPLPGGCTSAPRAGRRACA